LAVFLITSCGGKEHDPKIANQLLPAVRDFIDTRDMGYAREVAFENNWDKGARQWVRTTKGEYLFYIDNQTGDVVTVYDVKGGKRNIYYDKR